MTTTQSHSPETGDEPTEPTEPQPPSQTELTPESRRFLNSLVTVALIGGQNLALVAVIANSVDPIQPGWLIVFSIWLTYFTSLLYRKVNPKP